MSTVTTTSQPMTSSSFRRFITRHPLVAYFVIAFAGTWLFFVPLLLAKNGLGLLPFTIPDVVTLLIVLVLSTLAGPTLAALTVTAATTGRAGLRTFLRRYLQWRVGVLWYLLALFGFLLVYLLSVSIPLGAGPLSVLIMK